MIIEKKIEEIRINLKNFSRLFPIFSGIIVITCVIYCAIWWKPHPMTIFDIDCSIVCWNFCRTMSNTWAAVAIIVASISVISGILFNLRNKYATILSLFSGILTLPVGILPIFTALLHLYHTRNECKKNI